MWTHCFTGDYFSYEHIKKGFINKIGQYWTNSLLNNLTEKYTTKIIIVYSKSMSVWSALAIYNIISVLLKELY